jgi:NAD(P)-dependent dehydrogenase (short-subunit alcohol dehydrogenase family)
MSDVRSRNQRRRIAVVTGGGGGMGSACAARLADHMRIVITDASKERLERTAGHLKEDGADVTAIAGDLTNPETAAELAETVRGVGKLGALVHTAGVSPSMDVDGRRTLEVNLLATALVLDAFESLSTRGTAAVCIASISAHRPLPPEADELLLRPLSPSFFEELAAIAPLYAERNRLAYAFSKRGVRLLVQQRAKAWGQRGARICSVSPGSTLTPMDEIEIARGGKYLVQNTALGRRGTPEEIAALVAFLLSDEASYITGIDVIHDGGVVAGYLHHATDEVRQWWLDTDAD